MSAFDGPIHIVSHFFEEEAVVRVGARQVAKGSADLSLVWVSGFGVLR